MITMLLNLYHIIKPGNDISPPAKLIPILDFYCLYIRLKADFMLLI